MASRFYFYSPIRCFTPNLLTATGQSDFWGRLIVGGMLHRPALPALLGRIFVMTMSGNIATSLERKGICMAKTATRSEKLDPRLTAEAKRTLNAAASQRSVSEFVLESALARTAEILPDRRRFELNENRRGEFQAALDAQPRPLPRLKTLLTEPSVLETRRK
jgi:uncharacterized protein (DUF1778 family)